MARRLSKGTKTKQGTTQKKGRSGTLKGNFGKGPKQ